MLPGLLIAFFPAGAACWLLVTLGVHQDPQMCSCQAAFQLRSAQLVRCLDLFPPRCRTVLKALLRFLSAHSSSWLRSLWMAAQPFGISAQQTCLGSGPSWDTLLVTGLQLGFVSLCDHHLLGSALCEIVNQWKNGWAYPSFC